MLRLTPRSLANAAGFQVAPQSGFRFLIVYPLRLLFTYCTYNIKERPNVNSAGGRIFVRSADSPAPGGAAGEICHRRACIYAAVNPAGSRQTACPAWKAGRLQFLPIVREGCDRPED